MIREAAKAFDDPRRAASCDHSVETMLRQRVFALAAGEEDLNDHNELRHDILFQTAVNRDKLLASSSTLCRFENQGNRDTAIALHQLMVQQFIDSFDKAPKELILDFDATDNPIHGMQEGHRMLNWMEKHDVGYCVGIARNKVLERKASKWSEEAKRLHEADGEKHQVLGEFTYAAGSWSKERRVLIRAEHGNLGRNPRFVVTNLEEEPEQLYRKVYCARGEMENRIKEQIQLFSGRSSAHHWWANQHRLLLSALAYHLLERMRTLALQGTRLAQAECKTLRVRLLKIGAVISRNTCRIKVQLSSHCPTQDLFWKVAETFAPG